MAQSPEEMAAAMIRNLPEKTGRSLEEWLVITKTSGLEKHGAITKYLKQDHGLTHGFANLIAHKTLQAGKAADGEEGDPVAAQYAGPKAGLRPIYDAIVAQVSKFGPEVELSPKKSYVSLRRNKQFAIVQASTRTRVDVGLNLKGEATTERLEASGSFSGMCSHRVRLNAADQVDHELVGWLRQAYERS